MTNLFTTKTNFTAGELSADLLGRVDLKAYDNGAAVLQNVFIQPTGGVYRRPGLRYVDTLTQTGRLITFEKNATETYLMVVQAGQTQVYLNDELVATVSTPWTAAQLPAIRWCQGADALYLTHPDVAPQKLIVKEGVWTLVPFAFLTDGESILQPYHKYCEDGITLAASALTGTITLTASADVFTDRFVGMMLKLAQGYVKITAVTDATHATGTVLKKLITDETETVPLEATRSWGEPVFSDLHGWPRTVAFYQSRLVFGGSRALPNCLWFSQSGDLTNFELGEGYDAEGIEFSILSDQANVICALFAGRHLQIFTTNAEWMVSGDPLTPTNIQLKRQTQVGSPGNRYVPPIGIDGATIFPAANGLEIREFLFADVEQAYQATDLSLMAGHLIDEPQDLAYDKHHRQAYVIMRDGRLCVLTSFRSEEIQSWTAQKTEGSFVSVAVAGKHTFFIVHRGDQWILERLDDTCHTDCAFLRQSDIARKDWSDLEALNNRTVKVVADGIVMPDTVIQNGCLSLEYPAREIEVGLGFTHRVVPLPPVVGASNGGAPVACARLVKATLRVVDTISVEMDTGSGLTQVMTRPLGGYCLNTIPKPKTADIVVRALGWSRVPTKPLWAVQGDLPRAFKLVSVTSDIQIGG